MAGKIIADIIEAPYDSIRMNVANVTVLTANNSGLTYLPTGNVNINVGSTTSLTLGNVVATTANISGLITASNGIKFPASQAASADANTLDDYEEGSWTPDLRFGGGTTGITYSTRTGKYIKIGNLVQAQFRITLTNKGSSSGGAQVFGLPFASKEEFGGAVFGYVNSLTNNSSWNSAPQIPTLDTNSSYVFLRYISGGGNAAHTEGDFTNTSDIIVTATYITS